MLTRCLCQHMYIKPLSELYWYMYFVDPDRQLQHQEHHSQDQILEADQGQVQDQGHVQIQERGIKDQDQTQGHQNHDPGQGVVKVQPHNLLSI